MRYTVLDVICVVHCLNNGLKFYSISVLSQTILMTDAFIKVTHISQYVPYSFFSTGSAPENSAGGGTQACTELCLLLQLLTALP